MEIKAKIRGVRPLLMHNGALVDSQTEHAKAKSALAKKKPQTDADKDAIARLDFVGALYVDESGKIIIPDVNLLAVIAAGATKFKKGKDAKAGVFVSDHGVFDFQDSKIKNDGKGTVETLWKSGKYTDRRRVVIQRNAIMKVRPRFDKWTCDFVLDIDDEICNPDEVKIWLEMGGKRAGLGDFRPQFGRFEVEKFSNNKSK
ncbi:MAG: hypothetical protein ACR2P5_05715 [Gammaproteobacteria bacterium]